MSFKNKNKCICTEKTSSVKTRDLLIYKGKINDYTFELVDEKEQNTPDELIIMVSIFD